MVASMNLLLLSNLLVSVLYGKIFCDSVQFFFSGSHRCPCLRSVINQKERVTVCDFSPSGKTSGKE